MAAGFQLPGQTHSKSAKDHVAAAGLLDCKALNLQRHTSCFYFKGPLAVRVEDLSVVKARVDALGIADPSAFTEYLEAHPDFVADVGTEIRVVDVNDAALNLHGYTDKALFIRTINQSFSSPNLRAVRGAMEAIHGGRTALDFETTITTLAGDNRALMVRWRVPPGRPRSVMTTL